MSDEHFGFKAASTVFASAYALFRDCLAKICHTFVKKKEEEDEEEESISDV